MTPVEPEVPGKASRTREALLNNSKRVLSAGGQAVEAAGSLVYRAMLPLMAIYAAQDEDLSNTDANASDISARRRAIASAAGTKALLELIEIASIAYPAYDDAAPYAASRDGVMQAPHMRHILSLVMAANAMVQRAEGSDGIRGASGDDHEGAVASANASVAYIAVAPGEYQLSTGPLSPTAIRRSAMRERAYNQPQLAMLAREDNRFTTMGAGVNAGGMARAPLTAQQYGRAALGARAAESPRGSCGCGGSCGASGTCGCGCRQCAGGRLAFPPARRTADGECESLVSISCDTKWRIRECFKQSLCDLLRCLGDELCEDGSFAPNPDFGACLEGFVCSLVTCLPDAICPPPPPSSVCISRDRDVCDCNFAVGS